MCGRSFTTERGMKIHRTKMGCLKAPSMQRPEPVMGADKTSETSSQVANHSAGSLQAENGVDEQPGRPERIRFPKAALTTEWEQLDKELSEVLKQKVSGSIQQKISAFGKTIYNFCKSRYGVAIKANKKPPCKSRRQREIDDIRRRKKIARKQWKEAGAGERPGLKVIWNDLKKRHSELCKAERTSKKRKEKTKCKEEFLKEPFKFARKLFEQPRSGVLSISKEDLERHLHGTYSDILRSQELEEMEGTTVCSASRVIFDQRPHGSQRCETWCVKHAASPLRVPMEFHISCTRSAQKF